MTHEQKTAYSEIQAVSMVENGLDGISSSYSSSYGRRFNAETEDSDNAFNVASNQTILLCHSLLFT
jgi:hypothetical protein